MNAKELIAAAKHIRSIQDSHLFTCEEGDSKHTLGRGVGINWPLWREIKAIVKAYLATVREDDDDPLTAEWLLHARLFHRDVLPGNGRRSRASCESNRV